MDRGEQLDVETCIASARADSVADALAIVTVNAAAVRRAEETARQWKQELEKAFLEASDAGAGVRAIAAASRRGKTDVANTIKYARKARS